MSFQRDERLIRRGAASGMEMITKSFMRCASESAYPADLLTPIARLDRVNLGR